jgi:hypothetical protein
LIGNSAHIFLDMSKNGGWKITIPNLILFKLCPFGSSMCNPIKISPNPSIWNSLHSFHLLKINYTYSTLITSRKFSLLDTIHHQLCVRFNYNIQPASFFNPLQCVKNSQSYVNTWSTITRLCYFNCVLTLSNQKANRTLKIFLSKFLS